MPNQKPAKAVSERTTKDALMASPTLAKGAAAIAMGEVLQNYFTKAKTWYRERTTYTVSVEEGERVFDDLQSWLRTQVPDQRSHNLAVIDSNGGDEMMASPDDGSSEREQSRPLKVVINDEYEYPVEVEGHKVKVHVNKPESTNEKDRHYQRRTMRFEARSVEGQNAVIRMIEEIRAKRVRRKPVLKMATTWGHWQRRSEIPLRPLSSIILPGAQKQRIVADLGRFLTEEKQYVRLGIPYHRGYLFHGESGTGKSSLVKGLAHEYNLDIWVAALGDLENESGLMNLIADVGAHSLLLLEDIDTLKVARDRDADGGQGLTTSSLLNALDGPATPHGLITVMTTNRIEVLADALTRPGRMDLIEKFGLPGPREIRDMFAYFYDGYHAADLGNLGVGMGGPTPSQAQVAEIFKRHLDDPDQALADLMAWTPDRQNGVLTHG